MTADNPSSDHDYQQDKLTASAGDESARAALAARMDVRPEILYYLVDDDSTDVRRELAANMSTPRQADLILADDEEEAVRSELAGKVSQLVPDLDLSAQDKIHQMTVELVEKLARDQTALVRRILAETLRDVAAAPPHVINQLARDAELVVASPVLTFSPVLTDDDLLDIIANGPIAGALGAIAERKNVSEAVADAVIETDDVAAVALLLGNQSAQIREEALDEIIDRAQTVQSWHLPLVKRPVLPKKAAVRLARFVAESLVDMLVGRGDITNEDIADIRRIVDERILDGSLSNEWSDADGHEASPLVDVDDLQPGDRASFREPTDIVADLQRQGALDTDVVGTAMKDGDDALALAAVAALSGLEADVVDAAAGSGDPETLVALCHAAGLPVEMLVTAQRLLGGISRADAIEADGDGYPLDEESMATTLARLASSDAQAKVKPAPS